MSMLLKILAYVGLVLTLIPAILFFQGSVDRELLQHLATAGMLLWFFTAPFWINKKQGQQP